MNIRVGNGINLYYTKSGKGAPLLLLHGNGEDHTIFSESVKLLEKKFTVYAIDSRDHGKSDRVKELHYSDIAEDIYEFITRLDIYKPYVCGFSDGAIAALLLEIRHPAITSGIISCGANTRPEGIRKSALLTMKLEYRLRKDQKTLMMLTEPDITKEQLSNIKVPVLVIAGSHDLIREKETKFIASSIPDSALMILEGEDHGSYINKSQKIGYIILETVVNKESLLNRPDPEDEDLS